MKNSPRVRANRIKTLLAELRDLQRSVNHAQVCLSVWERAETKDQIRKLSRAHVNGNALVSWERAKELEDGEVSPQDFRTRCIESAQRAINSPKRRRWIDHTLNRLAYERDLLGPVARYEGELSPVILQAFAREHGAMKPTAKAVPEGFALESAVPLPLHIASEKAVTRSADEWRDLMQSVGYTVPEKKDAKPPILNFRAGEQEVIAASGNIYGRRDTFRQIELTKEQYSKVYKEVRGTRLSACGTFRFNICKDPTSTEAYFMRPWVAVFLTDSKEHPASESFKKQANAA